MAEVGKPSPSAEGADSGQTRKSRRELEALVESQKQQLSNYETRLRDVVRAYKGVVKEKEALDSVLKSGQTKGGSEKKDEGGALEGGAGSEELGKLREALKVITEEKSRLETSFTEDKKKSLSKIKALEGAKCNLEADRATIKAELEEMKAKWMVERHQRDKEADDYALQLRELQKVVAEERAAKESLDTSLRAAHIEKQSQEDMVPADSVVSKAVFDDVLKRANLLEAEVKSRDSSAKAEKEKHSEEVAALKRQMEANKSGHLAALEKAEVRASRAEALGAGIRSEQESRVVNLEARLQELSETVGTYDRLRQQDQSAISRLKERVHQLESEKTELQSSSSRSSPRTMTGLAADEEQQVESDHDTNLDVQSLMDRILRLKTLLKEANRRSENPVQLDDFLCDESSGQWKEMFMRLKEEVERQKNVAGVLQPPQSAPTSLQQHISKSNDEAELKRVTERVGNLQLSLREAHQEIDALKADVQKGSDREARLQAKMGVLREEAVNAKCQNEADLKNKIIQLEAEVGKQRQRCLTIIEEKEDEVAHLKSAMETTIEMAFRASNISGSGVSGAVAKKSSPSPPAAQLAAAAAIMTATQHQKDGRSRSASVTDDLTASSTHQTEGMVLYYEEELKLKTLELGNLRDKNREMESALRELQSKMVEKEEHYLDEVESLRHRVHTLNRMSTKEGANTEYLKNVVMTYMLTSRSSDAASREHMLKAIGAVLAFTDDDLAKVRDHNASWWWAAGGGAASASKKTSRLFKGGGDPKS